MKAIRILLLFSISIISISAFAQLEVQIGAGGLFGSLNEIYSIEPQNPETYGETTIRPYVSGLVENSLSDAWSIRARVVGVKRSDKLFDVGTRPKRYYFFDVTYLDIGAEIQWKPTPMIGVSVGPYYAINLRERFRVGNDSSKLFVDLYDNFVAIRPALEVLLGSLVARLDASIGLSPAQRYNHMSDTGEPYGKLSRYWNSASLGLSYRLIKA